MKSISLYTIKQIKEKGGLYDLDTKKISSPRDVSHIINMVLDLHNEAFEKFGIVSLNTKNDVTGIHILSIGTLNTSLVHPRSVYQAAMLNNACSIIAFHNHPSGDPTPSVEDVEVTNRLVDAGKLMGIDLLDHIIIAGATSYVSMKEYGLLNR